VTSPPPAHGQPAPGNDIFGMEVPKDIKSMNESLSDGFTVVAE